ncbi:MAG: hypothetical protein Q9223_007969, partial [Gallowayella weberi]
FYVSTREDKKCPADLIHTFKKGLLVLTKLSQPRDGPETLTYDIHGLKNLAVVLGCCHKNLEEEGSCDFHELHSMMLLKISALKEAHSSVRRPARGWFEERDVETSESE